MVTKLSMSEVLTAIINNSFEYGDTIVFYKEGDFEWYIKNQGLCEIGFKFKGSFKESNQKNTISIASWKEAIKRSKDIISVCKKIGWTIFADVYNQDNYTPKREKLAKRLGFNPSKVSGVQANNPWK